MANSEYKGMSPLANFAPLATLHDDLDYLDRTVTLGYANFPRIDSLSIGMAALCNDEFMAITGFAPGAVLVKRGVADTVPAQHAAHSLIWFIEKDVMGTDAKEHVAGEINAVKYSPMTIGGGSLDIEQSGEIDVVQYNWRFFRPYPPGQMRVRGERWYIPQSLAADNPSMLLTWAHRDRILQSDQLVDHDETNIGPEPGTTYTVRIYDQNGTLKRTEAGIMIDTHDFYGNVIAPKWLYTWQQAMIDLNGVLSPTSDEDLPGRLTVFSTRDGFDSWQGYDIPFTLNTQGQFIKVAQLAELAAQASNPELVEGNYPPATGLYGGQVAQIAAQATTAEDNRPPGAEGLYVAQTFEGAGQTTSFYSAINRNLFEAPYAYLAKRADDKTAAKLVTVAARPSDRLTDSHTVWTRYDYPRGIGASFPYSQKVAPTFTPWITLGAELSYLDTAAIIGRSSFYDGVALDNVQVGQVGIVDAEIVRIDAKSAGSITIARGCYDTVPSKHLAGARLWFFEAMAGNDPTAYPLTMSAGVLGAAAEVKMVPAVFGPPLDLDDVPTDRLNMQRRVERPYPPGQVRVNGEPWYRGRVIPLGEGAVFTWVHRNRDTQGAQVVDHLGPDRVPEPGQKYRLSISITIRPKIGPAYDVKIRNEIINGEMFEYTPEMVQTDGYRSGMLLGACGRVTVGVVLESIRDDFVSWQNYVIPIALPSHVCPPGQPPGGGQLPPTNGNGNGDTGTAPGDNTGDGPADPIDNGGGDDGTGPPPPPEVPPDWPDPIDPPTPDPDDPDPALAAHWDTNWDRHWDAYTRDNEGN